MHRDSFQGTAGVSIPRCGSPSSVGWASWREWTPNVTDIVLCPNGGCSETKTVCVSRSAVLSTCLTAVRRSQFLLRESEYGPSRSRSVQARSTQVRGQPPLNRDRFVLTNGQRCRTSWWHPRFHDASRAPLLMMGFQRRSPVEPDLFCWTTDVYGGFLCRGRSGSDSNWSATNAVGFAVCPARAGSANRNFRVVSD
jgi:hypothetical protein